MDSIASDKDGSEIHDLWRLCDELTVEQATLLTIGIDPSSETGTKCWKQEAHEWPKGYLPVSQAISSALRTGLINGKNIEKPEFNYNGNEVGSIPNSTDIRCSTIERDSFIKWLKSRGITKSFFLQWESDIPEYLDPNNPRYSSKLAAAISA